MGSFQAHDLDKISAALSRPAGYVDPPGANDGLDVELLRRAIQYARRKGYATIRALGWSNIRAYVM